MKKNQETELVCTDLSDQGFGIGHLDGKTIFVSDLLPNERARIRIIKDKKTFAIGKVIERTVTSSDRIEPRCKQSGRCGGCALQHMNYSAQLKYKEKQLKDLFFKAAPEAKVLPVAGMHDPYYYRNKAQFPIALVDGKVTGGFYKARTNEIVPVRDCLIQSKKINVIYQWLLDHLEADSARALRHLFIRVSQKTGQAQVVLIGRQAIGLETLTRQLVAAFPEIVSVVFNRNTRDDNVILGDDYQVLYGSDSIDEQCLGLTIRLHFKSFFQINPSQMEVLYSKALELADLKKSDRVIELYSGTGTIGLLAAQKAGCVTGVEIVPEAVANAQENALLNQIENAKFVCLDASEFAAQNQEAADVVFVDPPRKGMSAQGIEDIALLAPRSIIYISCNPRTLARDLEIFHDKGYQTDVIAPVDMFAQTGGVECVARLLKNEQQ